MSQTSTTYHNVTVDGLNIFYREAGDPQKPALILLHGFPSTSFMYRDLIPALADKFHLIAPDYPGFGNSDVPSINEFEYTFEHLADVTERFLQTLNITRYSLYVQDYGSPVGFRLATRHPEQIEAIIVQNGNAYEEGFTSAWEPLRALWKSRTPETEAAVAEFFAPETTHYFYTAGTRNPSAINPDNWNMDQFFLSRPNIRAAQIELFYDYRTNPLVYPKWHEYFRTHQPRMLIVWGKNDPFFGPAGAEAFLRDLPNAELHMLDTGHFALDEELDQIASRIAAFLSAA